MKIKICLKMQNEVWNVYFKNIWMKIVLDLYFQNGGWQRKCKIDNQKFKFAMVQSVNQCVVCVHAY